MIRAILVLTVLFMMSIAFYGRNAAAEEGHHSLGVQAGQVGLSQDVGTRYGSALGWGLFFDYASSDWLEFQLDFLTSKHTSNNLNYNQQVYGASIIYNVDQFDVLTPFLRGGAEFISATEDIPNSLAQVSSYGSTAFGLLIGIGAKVQLGSSINTGLDLDYHSVFDSSVTPTGNTTSVKAIQSFYTVMLRLGFSFGGK